ncbi:ABC transporter substrate-binding protein [Propioniciclava coleopterorum]|uniref:ABC transporter substrate-binding protein n=1 Tax=Propioniciclava coleopterorum TaxID=2714937 RepID=A0A6G7Y2G0_9ACTN|nr:ABC transporter substrate-binding protein [Propioniciclava coleopterorum]QIK71064.1 ABC transporter substrate-binding protein [Propioniciclava coleopterorum]
MSISRKGFLAGLGATVALAAAGCSTGPTAAPAPTGGSTAGAAPTPVTLMLNWYPYGEHAGFYYGVEKGIFARHGIDLKIQAGQGSTKTVQAVGGNQVMFGWADTPAVLSNIDKGVKARSVGVFLQTTPSSVQLFEEKGVKTPADLKGKTIAVSAGDAPTVMFPTYLKKAGLQPTDVQTQNLDAAGKISAVLAGQVDGLIGFAHDQGPTIAAKSGKPMTYLRYSDVGLNYFSNGLIVNPETISSKPELVKAMVAATSEAYAAAAKDVDAAAKSMEGKDPQMPALPVLTQQWTETIKLLSTDATKGKAPGTNAASDWDATIKVLADAGLIGGVKPASTYFDASFQPTA